MTHIPYPGCYCADCVEGTPSARIMSDKDRENPVEGAHPITKPEVDPLVAAIEGIDRAYLTWGAETVAEKLRTALAARGGRVVFDGSEG